MLEALAFLDHAMHTPFWRKRGSLGCKEGNPVFLNNTFHRRLLPHRMFFWLLEFIFFPFKITWKHNAKMFSNLSGSWENVQSLQEKKSHATRCSEPTCKAISRRLAFIYWEDTTGKQLAVTTQERLGLRAPTSVILAGKENPFLLKSRLPCDWEKLMGWRQPKWLCCLFLAFCHISTENFGEGPIPNTRTGSFFLTYPQELPNKCSCHFCTLDELDFNLWSFYECHCNPWSIPHLQHVIQFPWAIYVVSLSLSLSLNMYVSTL